MNFYDALASQYDALTGSTERADAVKRFCVNLVERVCPRSVLDVACGTGMYTLPLAEMGLHVVGSDLSAAMLEQARKNAASVRPPISWIEAPMQKLASRLKESFDAILCMGNSLPHLLEEKELADCLNGFAALKNPRGTVVLHLLNYHRLCRRKERIVGLHRQGQLEYLRFYDFLSDGLLRFNVLKMDWSASTPTTELESTTLRPWTATDLQTALPSAGLKDITLYGGIDFSPWIPEESDTLLILAR